MPTKVKDIMLEGTGLYSLFKRVAAEAGLNLVSGSFEEGGTLSNINDVLLHIAEARYYSWGIGGTKEVPAGSTPATAGGVGVGAWTDKTDLMLRSELNGGVVRVLNTDSLRAKSGRYDGDVALRSCYYADYPDYGSDILYWDSTSTEADNGGSVFAVSGVTTGRWISKTKACYVDKWGAKPNSGDSTDAFVRIRNYINTKLTGAVYFTEGVTYYITNHKDDGDTSYYGASSKFNFASIDGLVIRGEGSRIKTLGGSKFGSFSPTDGSVYNPTLPFTTKSYANSAGTVFNFDSCSNVVAFLPEGDGNISNLSLGGYYGDAGRQIQNTYCRIVGASKNIKIFSLNAHHWGLDGLSIRTTTPTKDAPSQNIEIFHPICEYNARQGFSLSGASGLTIYGGSFSHTGTSTFSSSPSAGVDIEPEASNWVTNVKFIGGEALNNTGVGLLFADVNTTSHNVVFEDFTAWGCINSAAYFDTAATSNRFIRGAIHGRIPTSGSMQYKGTLIDDTAHSTYGIYTGGKIYIAENCTTSLFQECDINLTVLRGPFGGKYKDTKINCAWDASLSATGGTAMIVNECTGLTVTDSLTGAFDDTNRFYVTISSAVAGVNALNIVGTGNGLRASSRTGDWGEIKLSRFTGLAELSFKSEANGTSNRILGSRSAAPTSGTFLRGDMYYSTAPAASGYIGWVCVAAGTPGTWKGFGAIAA